LAPLYPGVGAVVVRVMLLIHLGRLCHMANRGSPL
jgi:hypothetical protein